MEAKRRPEAPQNGKKIESVFAKCFRMTPRVPAKTFFAKMGKFLPLFRERKSFIFRVIFWLRFLIDF